ncbi:hypothetical protein DSO57_1039713 [Entomophthora muscae]|uniref:Uncharacterized protein n=1 Tax=Entomophthora muscae TaxID=34485 RepID=A0ACC2UKU6_9FUNG|nr:hypothetical protein DSO57_1039713 [Entomophthora muscae]
MSLTTAFISIGTQDQKLDQLIQTYGETSSFGAALCACRHRLQKYLPCFESSLHLIATILHPRAKVAYFDVIKPNLKERAIAAITEIFGVYNTEPKLPTTKKFKPNAFASDILSSVFDRLNSHKPPIQDELTAYLASATENVDILVYWKVAHHTFIAQLF